MNDLNVKSVTAPTPALATGPRTARPLQVVGHPAVAPLQPRPAVDQHRIARAVREILAAIGENPDREGLVDTPKRVARAYAEIFSGLREDPADHLARVFSHSGDEIVAVRGIEFHSVCEHHLLPFFGRAHIAYLPGNGAVVGVSKLARTVQAFARRPQIQERLTAEIADAIADRLQARAVAVIVEAEHLCMKMRGVRTHESAMATVAHRGVFASDRELRNEALALLRWPSGGLPPAQGPLA